MARKKKAPAPPKKGRARAAAETATESEIEVEEVGGKPAKPPMGIESALILVTFIALVAAFVLIQVEMRGAFGKGWPV